ncbi:hypothetical protein CEK26_009434 [Fusarium fujikuroi]|uniref:Uncharacterized protein n=1 Tax=Fusarium fujikuroi TaxID=5127 RepID=A0A5Q3FYX0_FUSFU|nr:hypothetical protein CEK27_009455 [Fusarium fujikuroi]QGI96365.1 hypothetical protein CEK26_009434 [Fusarium fujikuroi]SCO17831.1 uncharacterized protein FFE2_13936 [Fusarium fujikuroi]SCO50081.1 uncharacterized protein FFMR_10061 [Fusarium fujikuroi]SCO53093.1 uncharacterized protein FFNC_14610 [Fusarium fujikuroi]
MFNLIYPSDASRKATKKASRVMSSLKKTLWSTFSKTPKQHLKEQKPKYQLCSNPSITVTDTETGEEWDFIDHDELDGDLANSDDTRTLREELEINAREQEDLLRYLDGGNIASRLTPELPQSATILTNLPTPTHTHFWTPDTTTSSLSPGTSDSPTSAYTAELNRLTRQPCSPSPGLPGYDKPTRQPPIMFSMLVKKVTAFIKGPSDEDKNRDQKENTVNQPKDTTEPWEVIPTIKDEPWAVVVKSRSAIATFDDSGFNRQTQYERTYQYEFDRRVVEADRRAMREAEMRAFK